MNCNEEDNPYNHSLLKILNYLTSGILLLDVLFTLYVARHIVVLFSIVLFIGYIKLMNTVTLLYNDGYIGSAYLRSITLILIFVFLNSIICVGGSMPITKD